MSRSVTTVASGGPRRRPALLLAFLAAAALLATAALIALRPSPSPPHQQPGPAQADVVPDERSAAAAAVEFAYELGVIGVRRPSVYERRLDAIAAPGAERRIRAAFGEGAAQVRALVDGPSGVLRAVPMGYRVDSFDPPKAAVTVWMVTLAAGPELAPTAQWRLLTLDLHWTDDGWRVADGSGARGPSPRSPLPVLAAETATFRELRHVP